MLQYAPLRIDVDKAMQHQCFADLHQGKHAEALRGACDEPLDACSETDVASLDAHMVDDVAFITSQHAPMQDAESGAVASQHALTQDAESGAVGSEFSGYAAHDAQATSARRRRVVLLRSATTPFNSPTGSAGKRKQKKRHIS
jgi:hypothetical protein